MRDAHPQGLALGSSPSLTLHTKRNALTPKAAISGWRHFQLETSANGSDKLGLRNEFNWTIRAHRSGGEAKQLCPDKQFTNNCSACTVLDYDAAHRSREIVGRVRSLGIAPLNYEVLTCWTYKLQRPRWSVKWWFCAENEPSLPDCKGRGLIGRSADYLLVLPRINKSCCWGMVL